MKKIICPFCHEKETTLLCDFVIGFEWKGDMADYYRERIAADGTKYRVKTGKTYRVTASDGEAFTCDRPICRNCAENTGFLHFSGSTPFLDSIDLCPQCQKVVPQGCRAISREEAESERTKMWLRSDGLLRMV